MLRENKIRVLGMKETNIKATFYLKTAVRVINSSTADDALAKQCQFFFSYGSYESCEDFACTVTQAVRPVLSYNQSEKERRLILEICNAANLYLANSYAAWNYKSSIPDMFWK